MALLKNLSNILDLFSQCSLFYLSICLLHRGMKFPGSLFSFMHPLGGLPCNFEGVLASPLVNGYRNKCEFSVGYSLQGKITVGFMLGNFR